MKIQEAEKVKLLLESPGGRILQRLGREITPQAVYEVEIVILQHYFDRLAVQKKHGSPIDLNVLEITNAAIDILEQQKITGEPRCLTVPQYVATFYSSGAAGIEAQMQLDALGLTALAKPEGIEYLREQFPPEEEK